MNFTEKYNCELERIALIIPCYPNHYKFIYNLIFQLEKIESKVPLYIVFTSLDDYNLFEKKSRIRQIIIPENIRVRNYPTYKKFFALNELKYNEDHDYFIVCDSEIQIIEENFTCDIIKSICDTIFKNKLLYGGRVNNLLTRSIMQESANLLKNDVYTHIIREHTKDYSMYIWWSDLPIYKRDTLNEFFSLINYDNLPPEYYVQNHFDHLVYSYYLILFHDFKICDTSLCMNNKWSLESYIPRHEGDLKYLQNVGYTFSWVVQKFYNNYIEFLNGKTILIYHLDR